jgi:hypothetical protein
VLAGEQPGLCGLASFDAHNHPSMAMSYFNRDVPVLLFDGPQAREQALAMQTRFNVAIASALTGESLPPGFRLVTPLPAVLTAVRGSPELHLYPPRRVQRFRQRLCLSGSDGAAREMSMARFRPITAAGVLALCCCSERAIIPLTPHRSPVTPMPPLPPKGSPAEFRSRRPRRPLPRRDGRCR